MKKFTITGVFGVGLSVIANCADASIVSRGFLDETLTNYATNISLDLKADTADLTALSDIIGTLPTTVIGFENYVLPNNIGEQLNIIFNGDPDPNSDYMRHGLKDLSDFIRELQNKDFEIMRYLLDGYERGLVYGSWREWRGLTEMDADIKNNTAKIGTLPDGYESVGAALTAMNAKIDGKISDLYVTAE